MTRRRRQRQRLLLGLAALLLAVTGAQLAALAGAARSEPDSALSLRVGHARWISAPDGASTAWFRTVVDVPEGLVSGTLWLGCEQVCTSWVEGRRGPGNAGSVREAARPVVRALDVTAALHPGRNAVAVQVTDSRGGAAAVLARVVLQGRDGKVTTLDSTSTGWRATDDASLLGVTAGTAGAFTSAGWSDAAWVVPVPSSHAPDLPTDLPQDVVEGGLAAQVMTAPGSAQDLTLSTHVTLPSRPRAGWLRVVADGDYAVTVNGTLVRFRPATPSPVVRVARPVPLELLDVSRVVRSGDNDIVVHVQGGGPVRAYVDGTLTTDAAQVRLASGPGWLAQGTAATPTAVAAAWPAGVSRQALPAPPSSDRPAGPWLGAAVLLLLWLVGARVLAVLGCRPVQAAGLLALGALPCALGLGLVGVLDAYVAWPGSLDRTPVVLVLLALLVLGTACATAVLLAARRTPTVRLVASVPDQRVATPPLPREAPGSSATSGPSGRLSSVPVGLARYVRDRPAQAGVVAVALAATATSAAGAGRDPLWQDEVVSIMAADSIRTHGVPRLPSGLLYAKGELYHYLLAGLRSVTDSIAVLRWWSLLCFAATVLAVGLLLVPTLAPRRPTLQVVATAVFASAPAELVWSHEVRMYQQMQLCSVVFVVLFLRALTEGRRRQLVGCAVALLTMYLSHEESFVLLPSVAVALLVAWRRGWWRRRAWWVAIGACALVISGQVLLSRVHPPDFGQDLSNRPYVGLDLARGWFYYDRVFFAAPAGRGTLALASVLSLVGLGVSLRRREGVRTLAMVVLLTAALTTSLLFTVKIERYAFVLLPLLLSLACVAGADAVVLLRRPLLRLQAQLTPAPGVLACLRGLWVVPSLLGLLVLMASFAGAPRNWGPAVADVTGGVSGTNLIDYAPAATYVRAHWQAGDELVTLCPPDLPAHYLGRSPDRIVQTGRNKLLYVIERHGQATDTVFGAPVLLTGDDVRHYLSGRPRVWMVTDTGSYASGVPRDVKAALGGFRLQQQAGGSSVYLWQTS